MAIEVTTPPDAAVISTAQAKAHVRQDLDHEDDYIDRCVSAATQWAQNYTRRKFITQTITMTINGFGGAIPLPFAPVTAISEIRYLDSDGVSQILAPTVYTLAKGQLPFYVVPKTGQTWPLVYGDPGGVEIDFVVGYGDKATDVPDDIVQAVYLLFAAFYENKQAEVTGTIATALSFGPKELLFPHVVHL